MWICEIAINLHESVGQRCRPMIQPCFSEEFHERSHGWSTHMTDTPRQQRPNLRGHSSVLASQTGYNGRRIESGHFDIGMFQKRLG